jgi:hypothetical protein
MSSRWVACQRYPWWDQVVWCDVGRNFARLIAEGGCQITSALSAFAGQIRALVASKASAGTLVFERVGTSNNVVSYLQLTSKMKTGWKQCRGVLTHAHVLFQIISRRRSLQHCVGEIMLIVVSWPQNSGPERPKTLLKLMCFQNARLSCTQQSSRHWPSLATEKFSLDHG